MSWGNNDYGTHAYGTSPTGTLVDYSGAYNENQAGVTDLELAGPVLQLYEIESPTGTPVTRVVDFGDLEASSTPGYVTFNGDEYQTIHIARTDVEESIDGTSPELTLTVLDYDHTILGWVDERDGLVGYSVQMHIIPYRYINEPSRAISKTFRVARVMSLEGPSRIAITIAPPAFFDLKFPRLCYNRHRCHNDFQDRFLHDGKNFCNYPSDEFEDSTEQLFYSTTDDPTQLLYGWNVLNGTTMKVWSAWDVGDKYAGFYNTYGGTFVDIGAWDDTYRTGMFCYKRIGLDGHEVGGSGKPVVSVYIKMSFSQYTAYCDTMAGLLIQSEADESNWIFFGKRNVFGGTATGFIRVTQSGVSTDYDVSVGTDNCYHITFSHMYGTWYFNSWYEDPSSIEEYDSSGSYTSHGSKSATVEGPLRIGMTACGSAVTGSSDGNVQADFHHIRFVEWEGVGGGGHPECDRTITACQNRGMIHAFNGFLGMPNGRPMYV
jgi:hypothetical protein